MSEIRQLSSMRIAIVGLGLMGGSLAMALRGKCAGMVGIDRDDMVCSEALERGIVDQASRDAYDVLPGAGLIILALPVCAILEYLIELPSIHPGNAVIIDLGSAKRQIVERMALLPGRFDPVGGHPMCGKEKSTLAHADPLIFQNAPFALTPTHRMTSVARTLAEELATAIGSYPLWIDAETHDRWVSKTSHLPYLLASALAASLPLEVVPLIGPGYRSTSRLAGSSPEMMIDILKANRVNVLTALQDFHINLTRLEKHLEQSEYPLLLDFLTASLQHQNELLEAHERKKQLNPMEKGETP
jgi:prephenate dehydrogenase